MTFRALPFSCCPSLTCSVWILIISQSSFSQLVKKSLSLSLFLCSPGMCSSLLMLWPCCGPCQGCLPHAPAQPHPWHCFLLTFPGTLLFLVLSLLASQQGGSFLHQSPPLSGLSCRHGCWGSASILSEEQEECPFSVLV